MLLDERLLSRPALDAEVEAFRRAAQGSPRPEEAYSVELGPADGPARPVVAPRESALTRNADTIGDFCAEAGEHLEAADRYLLLLDADPANREALNAIYRAFHTIKGVASMLELDAVRTVAHEAENLLNLARDGKVMLSGPALDLAFQSVDALRRQVDALCGWLSTRRVVGVDPTLPDLIAALQAVASGKAPAPASRAAPTSAKLAAAAEAPAPAEHPPERVVAAAGGGDQETVRVSRNRLDKLINAIGELVIAQSMAQQEFDQLAASAGGESWSLAELSKISRDLQELSLSLRMVPMQGTFQKMARLVRELSNKMSKAVELEIHGEETELDKTVVDQLGDRARLRAKVFGGAKVLDVASERLNVGSRNAAFVLQYLSEEGISVAAQCLGGTSGLLVRFYPHTGLAWVKPLARRQVEGVVKSEAAFGRELLDRVATPPGDRITMF